MLQLKNSDDSHLAGKAVWLASYPKSGNTWFRCFLSALIDKEVDINKLNTDGIFSSRNIFSNVHDINSRYLRVSEVRDRLPEVFKYYVKNHEGLIFVKVHDAYILNESKKPIIPTEVSHACVYLVRNPLDVVASYANHMNSTIDNAIKAMNNKKGVLGLRIGGVNSYAQFPQLMFDWSGHVRSWLDQDNVEVHLVRYEDMKRGGAEVFWDVVQALGLSYSKKEVVEACQLSEFSKLKRAESDVGFREKSASSPSFFRQGKSDQWPNELSKDQASQIIDAHHEMMTRLGYDIPDLDAVYESQMQGH